MGIHWGRLALVLGVIVVLVGAGTGVYYFAFRDSHQSSVLSASAEDFLEQGDYASADVEVEKLLRLDPNSASAHFLKAKCLLAGKRPDQFGPTDSAGIAAVRQLIQAVTGDPSLIAARELLVTYFLSVGESKEASIHGRRILEQTPDHIEARYAVAAGSIQEKPQDSAPLVDGLLASENPSRPRTIWIAAQLGEVLQDRPDLTKRADEWLQQNESKVFTELSDQISMVELRTWKARRTEDPATVETQVRKAMSELKTITARLSSTRLSPRLILRTATHLLPAPSRRPEKLKETYAALEPEVNALIDDLFKEAATAQVLDPMLYIGQATRLRANGHAEAAVAIMKEAIQSAAQAGGENQQIFAVCDLWLAEHYLDEGKTDLAQPHIETLLASPNLRSMGEMLTGYRLMQQGDFEGASEHLSVAVAKLAEHGAAHALFGLCQLRRGMISEGRQHLEQGIRLGASSPRYKAWLTLALAEGGYTDQAIVMGRDILESTDNSAIGRALIGQLRLQAGDFEQAGTDLEAAYQKADAAFRPSIRLTQAELALNVGQVDKALGLIEELKGTTLAPQACALHYRHLSRAKKTADAEKLLAEARAQHPDSTLLLAVDVQRLLELERFDEAESAVRATLEKTPTAVAPILLLSEVLDKAGKQDQSIDVLAKYADQSPKEASLQIRLVEKLLSARNFPQAAQRLEQMKKNPTINGTTIDYLLARSAALQGDMVLAQQFIERAAAKDPDNPTLKFLMGQLAARRGDYSTASEMFEQSLAGSSNRQQAVQALFESLLRLGDTTKAVEVLSKAEKRGQQVRSLRAQLLRLLARQENWSILEREVDSMLTADPEEDDYLLVISALRYVRQPQMAVRYVQRALGDFPTSDSLREQEASLLLELGDYQQAEEKLAVLMKEQPTNAMFYVLRTYLLEQTDRLKDARQEITDAWQKCPGHPAIAALNVLAFLREGKVEQAMEFAERAKQDYPKLPEPRYLVARMHESLGNYDKALALLNVLVAEDPKNTRAAEHYFRILVSTGLPRDVQPAIEKLVTSQPKNEVLIGALAEYQALQGDIASAEKTIGKLQSIESSGPMVDYTKAVVAFARRDFKEAERLIRVVMADPRGHMPGTFLFAKLKAAQGQYNEALDACDRVCRQQPRNPSSHLFYARLLGEIGEWSKAETVARDFLKREPNDRSMQLFLARALLARGGDLRAKESAKVALGVYQEGLRGADELEAVLNVLFAAGESPKCKEIIAELESTEAGDENLLAAGRASFIAGDYASSTRLADRVLDRQPDNMVSLLLAADTATRLAVQTQDDSHYERAVELYSRILSKDPTNLAAANNLAWTLGISLGKEHRAMEEILRRVPAAAQASPTVPVDILDTVGTLHMRMNQLDKARTFFDAIIQRDPDNAMAYYRVGQILKRQNREDRAEQFFAKAREISPSENWEARKIEAGSAN